MPCLWGVSWIVERGDANDELCGNNGYAGANGYPREHVYHATAITLSGQKVKTRDSFPFAMTYQGTIDGLSLIHI